MDEVENVILVTIDCLRPDFLEFYGYRETMPNLSRDRGGLVIERAYANAPFTLGSVPSLMTSSYPLEGDPLYSLNGRPKPIYYLLKEKGYSTAGFNSNDLLAMIPSYREGFDEYWVPPILEDQQEMRALDKFFLRIAGSIYGRVDKDLIYQALDILSRSNALRRMIRSIIRRAVPYPYPTAPVITEKAIRWIESNRGRPFFMWIHYMDTHNPYLVSEDLVSVEYPSHSLIEKELTDVSKSYYKYGRRIPATKRIKEALSSIIKVYEDRIRRVDENIGRILDTVHNVGLGKETAVIVTSDHGQGFLEHGFYSHLAYFYDEIVRVPLIIVHPRKKGFYRKRGPFSLLDVAPTILAILGESRNEEYRGVNIIDFKAVERIFSEVVHGADGEHVYPLKDEGVELMVSLSLVRDRWKYIIHQGREHLKEELYDLVADPNERRDLSGDPRFSDVIDSLRRDYISHVKEIGFDFKKLYYRYRVVMAKKKLRKRGPSESR